jgi:3'-phosphoadenosine 5'-phosphosulfate sulfotransferase (PAPS reductase)/FAD synthetase
MSKGSRVVGWFSCGAASAVAIKMALAEYGPDIEIAYIDTGSEHKDNVRFRRACERWYDHEILVLKSEKYADIYDVFDQTGYLVGPGGARCTAELKKAVRHGFEQPDDLHVFGYTSDWRDAARAERFQEQNPGVDAWFPLVERELTKGDCLALIQRAGIRLPAMYRLGYSNNNCIGCVKGGKGYWNKIRVDFPDVFARMAAQERKMGRTVLRANGQPVPLDELDPSSGNYKAEEISDCSLDCQAVEVEMSSTRRAQ